MIRDIQGIIIWLALALWILFTFRAVTVIGIDVWQGVGFGTILGVLLKMLSDMWQFYFRKKPKEGGKE